MSNTLVQSITKVWLSITCVDINISIYHTVISTNWAASRSNSNPSADHKSHRMRAESSVSWSHTNYWQKPTNTDKKTDRKSCCCTSYISARHTFANLLPTEHDRCN